MATIEDAVSAARTALEKSGTKNIDDALLTAVAKSLGPSIYSADSKYVACSDKEEVKRVAEGFVAKKLGVSDGLASVQAVCEQMSGAGAQKHRAAFCYLLTKHHKKESVFS